MREYPPDANRLRGNEWEWADGMEGTKNGRRLIGKQEYAGEREREYQIREDEEEEGRTEGHRQV